jgi:hypothetical protein
MRDADRTSDVFTELSPPYATIVADPPWHYDAAMSIARGAAALRDRYDQVQQVTGRPGSGASRQALCQEVAEVVLAAVEDDELEVPGWVNGR